MRQKIVIIGAGIAAHVLASKLFKDSDVTMITKGKWHHSNSYRAQGGVAAAIAADDSWQQHFDDTIQAGVYHNNEAATELLVKEGKTLLEMLLNKGFPADRNLNGSISLGREGAHSKRRIIHAGGDQTGKYMMQFYQQILRNNINLIEDQLAVDCVMENGRCRGIITIDPQNQYIFHSADQVVLATGGYGGIFETTSNDETITGDGIAIAYRAGAKLSDLEFVQFHPTMLTLPEGRNFLISEAVRGEGARLIDQSGRYIMDGIHPQVDLAPRDIISRVINTEIMKGNQIFLDISEVHEFSKRFPYITEVCEKRNIDWQHDNIPVRPGAHFSMGGVETNLHGETNIPGLYAVGEVACTYVHGANRLASNSLLEGIVFATRLADHLLSQTPAKNMAMNLVIQQMNKNVTLPERYQLKEKMTALVGISRSEISLSKMLKWLEQVQPVNEFPLYFYKYTKKQIELQHMLLVAELVTKAARERTESRGAHYRSDFPEREEQWREKRIYHQLINQGVGV